jgi:hypothetical protein
VVTTGTHISGREDVARGKRHFSCTLHAIAELLLIPDIFY